MAFQSFASERFWQFYSELPVEVQRLADKQYELLQCEVGRSTALSDTGKGNIFRWGWIGSH